MLEAIYIEPPADVRSVPQNYTVHCITTGQDTSNITVGLFLETHGNSYYNQAQFTPPVSGYNQVPPVVSTLNNSSLTHDYSEEVVWSADTVEEEATEFSDQRMSRHNGDHDWACGVNHNGGYDDLQTYIRGENELLFLHVTFSSVC